ncbi:MAG: UDP-glucose 4-epimerase GalE [Deltaproteobacteria bacterium]|nr:UDP-glucose 4-epimerase GalE [Deltaproteobacteria bacterium]
MILVTGGAGYIGSHTCLELLNSGYEVTVIDNLSNSSSESLKRVEHLTGTEIIFYEGDIRDPQILNRIFSEHNIDAVIHFAGLKSVGESVDNPHLYYENNVTGSINLFKIMDKFSCKNLVFSSSATVYGEVKTVPVHENFPLAPTNPYGNTKRHIEDILKDISSADHSWSVSLLRYFNPIGAHESGRIGEDPRGIPNNLLPYISKVAAGKLSKLKVFGDDYDTPDGTGIRDYIHVVDLARGHIKALEKMKVLKGLITVNLGTGNGYSVFEVLRAFEIASKKTIPFVVTQRRTGDISVCYADVSYAKEILNWQAEFDINRMCTDIWRWQNQNPNGYED